MPRPDPVPEGKGLAWTWPASGTLLRGFDENSASKGLDIGGSRGRPVQAAAAGRVVYRGSGLRGYGQLIIIKHNEEFLSAYAHNDRIYIKEGDTVKRGQNIAAMGDTGSDEVMLHFEIRRNGKPVDPLKYLPKR
jgi:lipoprotein NlpD